MGIGIDSTDQGDEEDVYEYEYEYEFGDADDSG